MVSVLNSAVQLSMFEPGHGHCVVFLGKALYFHSTSLLVPGIQMGTVESNDGVQVLGS